MIIDVIFEESDQTFDVDFGEIQFVGGDIDVAIIEPLSIIENGTYTAHGDVDGYSPIRVNVPIPDGYIQPQGTIEITENGEYGITEYANARVNIEEAKEEQEKTIDITENGTTEVTPDDGKVLSKVTVNVDVEQGITPSGTLEITENGEYDVTEYASANVNVESESDLPDWDDDSPIIASGYGYGSKNSVTWEVTEKGTMRWKIVNDKEVPAYKIAIFGSSQLGAIDLSYQAVAHKVRQIYYPDGVTRCQTPYAINCERIRFPNTLTEKEAWARTGNLFKEIDLSSNIYSTLADYFFNRYEYVEKFILNPSLVTIPTRCFAECYSLKEINLENVTTFKGTCFTEDFSLTGEIVFNSGLISIEGQSFYRTRLNVLKFTNPLDALPTIANNSFAQCRELSDIYVPWAEGEVANAPWGATKATIHYNTTYDENHNPIVQGVSKCKLKHYTESQEKMVAQL